MPFQSPLVQPIFYRDVTNRARRAHKNPRSRFLHALAPVHDSASSSALDKPSPLAALSSPSPKTQSPSSTSPLQVAQTAPPAASGSTRATTQGPSHSCS